MEECFNPETGDGEGNSYRRGLLPKVTRRDCLHRVRSRGTSWVLSLRGPWASTWKEYRHDSGYVTLTHGRRVVG